ncbi:MAG: Urease accessory protein UreE [Rhodospirillales bacterium RIFCSPLOWO2_12_FULL_67_15]|nr:MAG: Urease accessory protein UreE [Rhodospirillales bacterium RIFCSPLOWO2_12_FULL_67_15]
MRRAVAVFSNGSWPLAEAAGTVTLAYHDRHRRRVRMNDDGGADFLLDLPQAAVLRQGDGLALEGGGYIQVRAALEAVADIAAESPEHLARLAWHIGNRHVPVQVLPDGALRILDDHVLVDMVRGLGARVVRLRAPFAPEAGAYAGGHTHDHDHEHHHHEAAHGH